MRVPVTDGVDLLPLREFSARAAAGASAATTSQRATTLARRTRRFARRRDVARPRHRARRDGALRAARSARSGSFFGDPPSEERGRERLRRGTREFGEQLAVTEAERADRHPLGDDLGAEGTIDPVSWKAARRGAERHVPRRGTRRTWAVAPRRTASACSEPCSSRTPSLASISRSASRPRSACVTGAVQTATPPPSGAEARTRGSQAKPPFSGNDGGDQAVEQRLSSAAHARRTSCCSNRQGCSVVELRAGCRIGAVSVKARTGGGGEWRPGFVLPFATSGDERRARGVRRRTLELRGRSTPWRSIASTRLGAGTSAPPGTRRAPRRGRPPAT